MKRVRIGQVLRFDPGLRLKTAAALGIWIPDTIIVRADKVIE